VTDWLKYYKKPERRFRTMIAAFAGWPDAAEASTRAVQYLVNKLPARKLADIDPEEFYDFNTVRPLTRVNSRGERTIRWPENSFFYSVSEPDEPGAILFVGIEPSHKWRAFTQLVLGVAEEFGVETVVTLGSLLDAVPHTRETKITGVATTQPYREELAGLGMHDSGYQGPSAIHTALLDACATKGIPYISLWGHGPHYVNITPNPVVSHALLTRLDQVAGVKTNLSELKESAEEFAAQVSKAVAGMPDIVEYVGRLEQQYDEASRLAGAELPSPEKMVAELEEFLKTHRRQQDSGESA
jgi:proteasome assembly chaperone (PAC2) family protein